MFTGIIESVGKITGIRPYMQGVMISIDAGLDLGDDKIGDSVSVDGVCLTITAKKGSIFDATASAETISRSTLSLLRQGSKVNIERALTLSARLGGHMVSGHVDTMGTIVKKSAVGESTCIGVQFDKKYSRYIIEKGSIAIDGVSLTVNRVSDGAFEVNIIPYTLESTSLTLKGTGDRVNLEFDVIGKYIESLMNTNDNTGLEGLLKKQGFI